MADHWTLPSTNELNFSGPEWLLQMLQRFDAHQGSLVVLICWRIWFVRNEMVHNKRFIPCAVSVSFLCSYLHELIQAHLGGNADQKGKGPALFSLGETSSKRSVIKKSDVPWEPPPFGWLKVNVDDAYTKKTGKAGAGIIIRNHFGEVLLSAWKVMMHDQLKRWKLMLAWKV
jgi:hypothetical protein